MIDPMLLPVPASFLASKDLGAVLRILAVSLTLRSVDAGGVSVVALSVPGMNTDPALPLTASYDQVLPRVGVALGAVCPSLLFKASHAASDVFPLCDLFQVADFNTVSVAAPSCMDVIESHARTDWSDRPFPRHTVRVALTEQPVAVRVVGALPAQTPGYSISDRRRIVGPLFTFHHGAKCTTVSEDR